MRNGLQVLLFNKQHGLAWQERNMHAVYKESEVEWWEGVEGVGG